MFNTLTYEQTKKEHNKGDIVDVLIKASYHKAKVVDVSVEDFYIKYCLEFFEDGSRAWYTSDIFKTMLN